MCLAQITYRTPTEQNRAPWPRSLQLLTHLEEQGTISCLSESNGKAPLVPQHTHTNTHTCATFHTRGWVISAEMKHLNTASSLPAFQKCLFAICSHCTWSECGRAAKRLRRTLTASYWSCLRISVWSGFIKVAPPAFVSLNVLLPKVINTD